VESPGYPHPLKSGLAGYPGFKERIMTEDETLDGWLKKEITDMENVVQMYRSYRQSELHPDALRAIARLNALQDVKNKMQELWIGRP
jgi:hypothetical protein